MGITKKIENKTLHLRFAKKDDCRIIWEWRNEQECREVSFNSDFIAYKRHKEWFYEKLCSKNTKVLIVTKNKSKRIGQVRIEIDKKGEGIINIALAKNERGKGYGKKVLRLVCKYAFENIDIKRIVGYIRKNNKVSIGAFKKAGFVNDGLVNYKRFKVYRMSYKKPARVALRVDANSKIGFGHFQRCLALANQLMKIGADVIFIFGKDEIVRRKLKKERFKFIEIKNNISLKQDVKATIQVLKRHKTDILITDSYRFTEDYLTSVKKEVQLLVSFDDFGKIAYPSDIVINGNIYAENINYKPLTAETKYVLGPKYIVLRNEFCEIGRRDINKKVNNILVTLGGNDYFNIIPEILTILNEIENDFIIKIIIGPFFNNVSEIKRTIRNIKKKVILVRNPSSMFDVMVSSDLAICGGGGTLYELAAVGTPALAFCFADNQIKNIKKMAEKEIIVDLGWGDKINNRKIYKKLYKVINSLSFRRKANRLGQELVDGNGSLRCARKILDIYLNMNPH